MAKPQAWPELCHGVDEAGEPATTTLTGPVRCLGSEGVQGSTEGGYLTGHTLVLRSSSRVVAGQDAEFNALAARNAYHGHGSLHETPSSLLASHVAYISPLDIARPDDSPIVNPGGIDTHTGERGAASNPGAAAQQNAQGEFGAAPTTRQQRPNPDE